MHAKNRRKDGGTDMTSLIGAFRYNADALQIREKVFLKLCVYKRGTKTSSLISSPRVHVIRHPAVWNNGSERS